MNRLSSSPVVFFFLSIRRFLSDRRDWWPLRYVLPVQGSVQIMFMRLMIFILVVRIMYGKFLSPEFCGFNVLWILIKAIY